MPRFRFCVRPTAPLGGGLTSATVLAAFWLATLAPAVAASPADTARTAAWLDTYRQRPPLLRQFLQQMPKGADLHSHFTGAVYAESYLAWAAEAGYCADPAKGQITPPPCTPTTPRLDALPPKDRSTLVDQLSTRNLAQSGRAGHDQFFDSFSRFGPAANTPDALAKMRVEITQRAASQHISHLELMSTLQGGAVRKLGERMGTDAPPTWASDEDMARQRAWLLANGLPALVAQGRQLLDDQDTRYAQRQGCGGAQAQSGCDVSIGWLQQSSRTQAPALVFAQLTFAFEMAAADGRVVGVNLVAPEDDPVALRDYSLHMRMVGFLARQRPGVKIALHAGELSLGLVPPEHLRFHIREAVEVAGAHRIGHAADLGHEDDALELLHTMKARHVAAEICLSSNDIILNVRGVDHPFPDYLAAGVPVVLASDDEGVSRIDLTNEYLRATRGYGLSYAQLKQLSRNSLSYSFLPGASLWQDDAHPEPVLACRHDELGASAPSTGCQDFLRASPKAQRQWALEAAFTRFETLPDWHL